MPFWKPPSFRRSPWSAGTILAGALLALLSACGGGASDAPNAVAPVPAPPVPAPSPGTRATCGLPNFESEMLARVNAARAAGASCGSAGSFAAAPPLAWSLTITQAALRHSDDMVARDFFDHRGSDGSSAGDRLSAAGYAWSRWGENIAAGQPSVAEVVGRLDGQPRALRQSDAAQLQRLGRGLREWHGQQPLSQLLVHEPGRTALTRAGRGFLAQG